MNGLEEVLNNRYRILRTLGAGGMATVYEVMDEVLRVRRAVKVLSPSMAQNEKIRQRFLSEARTMAQLRHPHIVTVYDVAVEGQTPYIVMEFLAGGSLMDLVDKAGGGLPPHAACRFITGMLRGLQCAHDSGVIHRDVKPHNVLLQADGTPQLTDFGIAHNEEGGMHLTKTGVVMGTLAYMAPEQRISARRADARSDIYAAGAALYVVLTGQEPFDLYATEFHDRLFKDVHPALANVVKAACRFEPDARFQTADAMADALEAVLHDLGPDPAGSPAVKPRAGSTSAVNLAQLSAPSETVFLGDEDSEVLPATRHGSGAGASDTIQPPATVHPTHTFAAEPATPAVARRSPAVVGAAVAVLLAVVGGVSWWTLRATPAPADTAVPSEVPAAGTTPPATAAEAPPAPPVTPPAQAAAPVLSEPTVTTAQPVTAPATKTSTTRTSRTASKSTAPTAAPDPAPATAATPAPTAAAATGSGQVRVNSRPWSTVTEGGKTLGRTGWKGELPAGRHELTLTTADGRTKTTSITVRDGKEEQFCWDFDASDVCAR